MSNAFFQVPYPENEPVLGYGPGSPERAAQLAEYERMLNQDPVKVPMVIGGKAVFTDDQRPLTPPHDHKRVIGHAHFGKTEHVKSAIDAALEAPPVEVGTFSDGGALAPKAWEYGQNSR